MPGAVEMLVAGRYLLAEPVGQGGAGRVWRASDQLLAREVAVKEIPLPPAAAPGHAELRAAATRAAREAARLDHPGVITVLDVAEHGDALWVVMRLAAGPSLATRLAGQGPMPWRQAALTGGQVADALGYAHEAGVVHGDLKPGNVLLAGTAADRVLVTDFGIARALDTAAQPAGLGQRFTNVHYLAPEQLEDGHVGPPADLWALGVLLYQATEGRLPFAGSSTTAVIAAVLTGRRKPAEQAGPLAGLIDSLLSADPAARPDAGAVATALAAMAESGAPVTAPLTAPVTAPAVAVAPPWPTPAVPGAARDRAASGERRPRPAGPGARLAAVVRANPGLAVGLATGIIMVLALLLVTTVFSPTAHRPAAPGGSPASPATSVAP